jgi:foldase protein PrsA
MKKAIAGALVGAAVVGGVWFFSTQDKVVAKVGDVTITEKDFYKKLEQGPTPKEILRKMIDDQVVIDQAKQLNIKVEQKEIDEEMDKFVKERFQGNKSQLETALKDYNMTIDELKKDIEVSLLSKKIATKDITITEDEIKDYYEKNKETLGQREEVKARHILVKDEAKAKELLEKVKANPNDFGKLAKENSEDPGSKESGGEMPPFGKGAMVPEFEKAAFEAKVNEIVGPVKSQFGYHIIQVLEHKEAKIPPLDEVKEKITETLKEQKAKPFQDLINELRAKESIEIKKELYKDILNPPAMPTPGSGSSSEHSPNDGHDNH